MSSFDQEIGEKIRERRQARGLTFKKLGDAIGVSYQQIQKYERGDNRVSAEKLHQISRILGYSVVDFLPAGGKQFESSPFRDKRSLQMMGCFHDIRDQAVQDSLFDHTKALAGLFEE